MEFTSEMNEEGFSVTECLGDSMDLAEMSVIRRSAIRDLSSNHLVRHDSHMNRVILTRQIIDSYPIISKNKRREKITVTVVIQAPRLMPPRHSRNR